MVKKKKTRKYNTYLHTALSKGFFVHYFISSSQQPCEDITL